MLSATKNSGVQQPLIEAGLHEAVCYAIVDVGTSHNDVFNKDQRKVVFIWEIPDSRIDIPEKGNLPRALSKHYTNSLQEKANLRKDLVSWRTKEFTKEEEDLFEFKRVLGASCLLNIIHKEKRNGDMCAAIENVLPLKGKKLTAENNLILYGIEEHGLSIPKNLPPWLIEEIKVSPEYQAILNPPEAPQSDQPEMELQGETAPDDGSELPF